MANLNTGSLSGISDGLANLKAGAGGNAAARGVMQSSRFSEHGATNSAFSMPFSFNSISTPMSGGSIGQIWNQEVADFIHSFH